MIEVGILKNFDSGTYKAGVQLAGSLTTYFDDISVAKNIPSSALVIGNYVIVAIPGGNPKDACVIATWPGGSPGGGAGSFLDLSDTPASYSGQAGKIARVASAETALEFVGAVFLPDIVGQSNFIMIPTNAGWGEFNVNSGDVSQEPMRLRIKTGTDPNSRGHAFAAAYGFNEGGDYAFFNYDKALYIIFNVARFRSDAEVVARIQIKEPANATPSEGALSGKGIGFEIQNYTLYGESYGTARDTHALGVTLADSESAQIKIVLDPGTSIKWYVNDVLKATETDAAHIPAGTARSFLVSSIINGDTGGTDCYNSMLQGKIWQE